MHQTNQPPNIQQLDLRDFKIIYPLYINSNRTQQQGRRISKERSVPDPSVDEIEQVLSKIPGAQIMVELDKRHPREINWDQRHFLGRVRVHLPANCELTNKYRLLLHVADEIAKLERKKIKVQQLVEQPEQAKESKNQVINPKNQKKQTGNRKKNSRKK